MDTTVHRRVDTHIRMTGSFTFVEDCEPKGQKIQWEMDPRWFRWKTGHDALRVLEVHHQLELMNSC